MRTILAGTLSPEWTPGNIAYAAGEYSNSIACWGYGDSLRGAGYGQGVGQRSFSSYNSNHEGYGEDWGGGHGEGIPWEMHPRKAP